MTDVWSGRTSQEVFVDLGLSPGARTANALALLDLSLTLAAGVMVLSIVLGLLR
jgi:hypothetical protein